MPATATATCTRCNGSGQYNGTRRDGSSYTAPCFACQGYSAGYRGPRARFPRLAPTPVDVAARSPLPALGMARGPAAIAAFGAAEPAAYAWLVTSQEAGNEFAMSLLRGISRYGNLTPRQLAAVQRNLPKEAQVAAVVDIGASLRQQVADTGAGFAIVPAPVFTPRTDVPIATPVQVTIDAGPLRAALDAAAASGLRKVRLDLGAVTFKRTGPTFRAGGEGHILCYHAGSYCGRIDRANVWHARLGVSVSAEAMAAFTLAATDPEAAARAHGADTTRCSCCRRTLTDPVSVMQGIGPVCIERFGWRLR